MKINERIKEQRTALGFAEADFADRVGLSIYELGDVEARPDEFLTSIPARKAIRVCLALSLSLRDLLGLDGAGSTSAESVAVLVRKARQENGLAETELDDRLGYERGFIAGVEAGSIDLKDYPLELTLDIADQTRMSRLTLLSGLEREVVRSNGHPSG